MALVRLFLTWIAVALIATPALAQTFPELTGRVVDQADLLRPEQELDLESKLAALETQSGRQFVVATVNSLEDQTIEDYGYRLGREWGIGSEENDDGVILLVAPNERKVRIETGYGAEGFLTDIVSGRIIRDAILPRFRNDDMPGGIMAGADEIIRWMQLPEAEAVARAEQIGAEERQRSDGPEFAPFVVFGMIFLFMILSMVRRASGRRYRGKGKGRPHRGGGIDPLVILWGLDAISKASRGGGGGGGFGGFGGGGGGGFGGFSGGGGSFGGGGASGGW